MPYVDPYPSAPRLGIFPPDETAYPFNFNVASDSEETESMFSVSLRSLDGFASLTLSDAADTRSNTI